MKKLTPQQKSKLTKEYRAALHEMLSDLSVDEETENFYQLTVDKDRYDAWIKMEDKLMRHGLPSR
jgi:hypothetical protein